MQGSKNKVQFFALIIWFLAAFFFFYEFLLQASTSVLRSRMTETFHINATQFGFLSSFYFMGYSLVQIPAGMLLDRFGPRKLLTIAVGLCAFGTLMMAISTDYTLVLIARFLTGIGSGFAMLGALVLTANWFSSQRFALMHGLTLTIGIAGAVFGGAPLGLILRLSSWRGTLMTLGILGIVLMVSMWFIIRDRPQGIKRAQNKHGECIKLFDLLQGVTKIINNKQTWLTALYGALMYAPTATLSQWTTSYLPVFQDYSEEKAAWLISIMFIGWIFGSPIFGAISDFVGRRKFTLYVSSISTFCLSILILYVPHFNYFTYNLLYFSFGFFTCGFVPSFSIVREQHALEYSGSALGFMNMINSFGPCIAPLLVGILLDSLCTGILSDTQKVCSVTDYRVALSVVSLSLFAALLVLPFIKETFCRTLTQRESTHA